MTQFSDFVHCYRLFLRCSRTLRFHTGWSIDALPSYQTLKNHTFYNLNQNY